VVQHLLQLICYNNTNNKKNNKKNNVPLLQNKKQNALQILTCGKGINIHIKDTNQKTNHEIDGLVLDTYGTAHFMIMKSSNHRSLIIFLVV